MRWWQQGRGDTLSVVKCCCKSMREPSWRTVSRGSCRETEGMGRKPGWGGSVQDTYHDEDGYSSRQRPSHHTRRHEGGQHGENHKACDQCPHACLDVEVHKGHCLTSYHNSRAVLASGGSSGAKYCVLPRWVFHGHFIELPKLCLAYGKLRL